MPIATRKRATSPTSMADPGLNASGSLLPARILVRLFGVPPAAVVLIGVSVGFNPSPGLPLSSDGTDVAVPARVTAAWFAITTPSAVAALTSTRKETVAVPPGAMVPRLTSIGASLTTAPWLVTSEPATNDVHGFRTPVHVGTGSVMWTLVAAAEPLLAMVIVYSSVSPGLATPVGGMSIAIDQRFCTSSNGAGLPPPAMAVILVGWLPSLGLPLLSVRTPPVWVDVAVPWLT